ncbi:MAG: hypothetical protein A2189_00095 [Paenibacillus sp. RIFOXYA1_FULL_44_5]|nr:MAG: hypothetical protein A2189_00095 [Paenibacillus sp. RIFOXYA1_FULL_44_5]
MYEPYGEQGWSYPETHYAAFPNVPIQPLQQQGMMDGWLGGETEDETARTEVIKEMSKKVKSGKKRSSTKAKIRSVLSQRQSKAPKRQKKLNTPWIKNKE